MMTSIQQKSALVIGAGSGVGRAVVKALASQGARVGAVARGREALDKLAWEVPQVQIFQADAADPATAQQVLQTFRAELVVLAAGVRPHMATLDEQTWGDVLASVERRYASCISLAQSCARAASFTG